MSSDRAAAAARAAEEAATEARAASERYDQAESATPRIARQIEEIESLLTAVKDEEDARKAALLSQPFPEEPVTPRRGSLLVGQAVSSGAELGGGSGATVQDPADRPPMLGQFGRGRTASGIEVLWSDPPPLPAGQTTFNVDFRIGVEQLTDVDTVTSMATLKIGVVMYWTDARLVGWSGKLPARLWGPYYDLYNKTTATSVYTRAFALVSPQTGRVKRTVVLEGAVLNPMALDRFPFDADDIVLSMWSASTWQSLDGTEGSPLPTGRTYELRKVQSGAGEGTFFALGCDGKLPDWDTVGFSSKLTIAPTTTSGQQCDEFTLRIHVLRKSSFYMWKTVMPIWMLSAYSLKVFAYDVGAAADRDALGSTLILATFAMLYVTGSYLPKTDFLTSIDLVTIATLALQFAAGAATALFYILDERGHDAALLNLLNRVLAALYVAVFVALNLLWLLPDWKRQRALRQAALATTTATLDDGFEYTSIGLLTMSGLQPSQLVTTASSEGGSCFPAAPNRRNGATQLAPRA